MKFKVGDRVAIYGTDRNMEPIRGVSTIEKILENEMFYIEENPSVFSKDRDLTLAHPKQCRKLKKKPLRRVWVLEHELTEAFTKEDYVPAWKSPWAGFTSPWIELVEVKKK